MYPDGLYYTRDHEWVAVAGEIGTVGITHHAQDQLGDIVLIKLPEIGLRFEQGTSIGTIDSVKASSDIYAPLAGEVAEVNQQLAGAPEILNSDPYGEGWIARVRLADPSQVKELMSAGDYRAYVESGGSA